MPRSQIPFYSVITRYQGKLSNTAQQAVDRGHGIPQFKKIGLRRANALQVSQPTALF